MRGANVWLITLPILFGAACSPRPIDSPNVKDATARPANVEDKDDDIDKVVKSYLNSYQVPCASLAVVKDGKIFKRRAYGFANLEFKVPATDRTLYPLASPTKLIAATAVLMLVDQNKIGFDDKIDRHLAKVPEAWREITIRQLLTHSSGLPEILEKTKVPDFQFQTIDELFTRATAMPLVSKPGERSVYIQTDYALLGMIVEKASGLSFKEYVAQKIFQPLGMSSTVFGDTAHVVPERATLYTTVNFRNNGTGGLLKELELLPSFRVPEYAFTCAGLNSTPEDLAKWIEALDSGRLIQPQTLKQMWEIPPSVASDGNAFGCGWLIQTSGGAKIAWGMGGSVLIYREVESRLTIILITNCFGFPAVSTIFGIAEYCRSTH